MAEKNKKCVFCHKTEDNGVKYGQFYEAGGITTHYFCMLLSSGLDQKGADDEGILGFLPVDIRKELKRGKSLKCSYCRLPQATIGCCLKHCRRCFHLPCALEKGSLHQFFGEFRSYCPNHRSQQKVDLNVIRGEVEQERYITCPICFEDVERQASCSTLWAPCCKKNAWFHRDCVQRLAYSQGYFFRCPLCNNDHEFKKEMLMFGIFVPEQDASWEMVPNAFEDLLYRYNKCDAKRCHCPKGRAYNSTATRWEIALCSTCGSSGIHIGCGDVKWQGNNWQCVQCQDIINSGQKRKPNYNHGSRKKRKCGKRGRRCTTTEPSSPVPSENENEQEKEKEEEEEHNSPVASSSSHQPPLPELSFPQPTPSLSLDQAVEEIPVSDSDSDIDVVAVIPPRRLLPSVNGGAIPVVPLSDDVDHRGIIGHSGESISVVPIREVVGDMAITARTNVAGIKKEEDWMNVLTTGAFESVFVNHENTSRFNSLQKQEELPTIDLCNDEDGGRNVKESKSSPAVMSPVLNLMMGNSSGVQGEREDVSAPSSPTCESLPQFPTPPSSPDQSSSDLHHSQMEENIASDLGQKRRSLASMRSSTKNGSCISTGSSTELQSRSHNYQPDTRCHSTELPSTSLRYRHTGLKYEEFLSRMKFGILRNNFIKITVEKPEKDCLFFVSADTGTADWKMHQSLGNHLNEDLSQMGQDFYTNTEKENQGNTISSTRIVSQRVSKRNRSKANGKDEKGQNLMQDMFIETCEMNSGKDSVGESAMRTCLENFPPRNNLRGKGRWMNDKKLSHVEDRKQGNRVRGLVGTVCFTEYKKMSRMKAHSLDADKCYQVLMGLEKNILLDTSNLLAKGKASCENK